MLWYKDRRTLSVYMVQTLVHLTLSRIYDHNTTRVLGMQTWKDGLLSNRAARLQGRGLEISQQAFSTSSRSRYNLEPAISLQIQVPEQNQHVDQVIQQTRLAGRARGYPSYPTFTDRVICGLRGKLSHYSGALRCS